MENPFRVLANEQLGSVIFVQNYLQLDFDGYIITCYKWPIISTLNGIFDIANREYRNELCSLITKEVSDIIFIDNERLDIKFQSGEQIKFNLKEAKDEVIYFTTPEGEWSSI
jgi:hypothetical protein